MWWKKWSPSTTAGQRMKHKKKTSTKIISILYMPFSTQVGMCAHWFYAVNINMYEQHIILECSIVVIRAQHLSTGNDDDDDDVSAQCHVKRHMQQTQCMCVIRTDSAPQPIDICARHVSINELDYLPFRVHAEHHNSISQAYCIVQQQQPSGSQPVS